MKASFIAFGAFAVLCGLGACLLLSSNAQILFGRLFSERDVSTRPGVKYGVEERQSLDVYEPVNGAAASPIVLFVHGGSWRAGDRRLYGFLGAAFAARGVTTVIPDYRLFPAVAFPAFVEDAALAYRWVHDNFARDARRPVILMGHSAGAHIAALLAYDKRYIERAAPGAPRPAGFIGLAGPYAFDPTTWDTTAEIFITAAGRPDEARPVAFVDPSSPPSLLFHGGADRTVKPYNQRTLAKALQDADVPVSAFEPEGVGHLGVILAFARPLRWRAPVFEECLAFVRRFGTETAMGSDPLPQP